MPRAAADAKLVESHGESPAEVLTLAGGHCLRAPAQGPCSYANICEHFPSFRHDLQDLPTLTRQRDTVALLADDATTRGWDRVRI